MTKLDPQTDGATRNIVDGKVDARKALVPAVLTKGKIDFEAQ